MRFLTACFTISLFIAACTGTTDTSAKQYDGFIDNQLQNLLNEKEYFSLQQLLNEKGDSISPSRKTYFTAFINSAFNHPEESNTAIDQLLKDTTSLNDSAKVALLLLQRDNYFRTFQYPKAAAVGKELLARYKSSLSGKQHDIENTLIIHEGLANVPAQLVHSKPDSFNSKKNSIGLVELPIHSNNKKLDIIFDTRAHISTVTKSFAKTLGLKILPVTYEESSGITGKKFPSQLGIADSFYVGHTLVEHVVFQVVPDEILYFPSVKYQMNGILGFPVLTALKQIRFKKDGTIIIGPGDNTNVNSNLAFDGSTTVVSFKTDDDTLSYHFDTGATGTELYSNFFNKYPSRIVKEAKPETIESGGAGGSIKRQVYIMPLVTIYIGDKKATLKNVAVHTTPTYKGQKYYGNIGQDLISQFTSMTMNFDQMYLAFE